MKPLKRLLHKLLGPVVCRYFGHDLIYEGPNDIVNSVCIRCDFMEDDVKRCIACGYRFKEEDEFDIHEFNHDDFDNNRD